MKMRLPSFATNYVYKGYQNDTRLKLFIGDTDNDSASTKDNTAGYGSYSYLTSSLTLGVYNFGANAASGTNGLSTAMDIVTPIHTSHHYQSFETLYLHELIGGDRSMEQTNLICSSDGKSWDEVTRDTSYIGNLSVFAVADDTQNSSTAGVVHVKHRGTSLNRPHYNKDFAISYEKFICLRTGVYTLNRTLRHAGYTGIVKVNGNEIANGDCSDEDTTIVQITVPLKRGDYVVFSGGNNTNEANNFSFILRAD